jgi:hypothetical protein
LPPILGVSCQTFLVVNVIIPFIFGTGTTSYAGLGHADGIIEGDWYSIENEVWTRPFRVPVRWRMQRHPHQSQPSSPRKLAWRKLNLPSPCITNPWALSCRDMGMITDDANGRIPCLCTRSGRMEGFVAPPWSVPMGPRILCKTQQDKAPFESYCYRTR